MLCKLEAGDRVIRFVAQQLEVGIFGTLWIRRCDQTPGQNRAERTVFIGSHVLHDTTCAADFSGCLLQAPRGCVGFCKCEAWSGCERCMVHGKTQEVDAFDDLAFGYKCLALGGESGCLRECIHWLFNRRSSFGLRCCLRRQKRPVNGCHPGILEVFIQKLEHKAARCARPCAWECAFRVYQIGDSCGVIRSKIHGLLPALLNLALRDRQDAENQTWSIGCIRVDRLR